MALACIRLGIDHFNSHDFFSPVSDTIHSSDPFQLVFCFEGFCDSFSGFHLAKDQFIAFLRLVVQIMKDGIELA